MVGTTTQLSIMLGDGVHSCGPVVAQRGVIDILGTGSLAISQNNGVLCSAQTNGVLFIDVDIADASTSNYLAAFIVSGNGLVLLRPGITVSLTKADAMMYNGHGQNSLYISGASVISAAPIPKVSQGANTEPMSLSELSATYTNIT